MQSSRRMGRSVAAVAFVVLAGSAWAGVVFGNTHENKTHQVNFAADHDAMTVTGEAGNTGVAVFFEGFGAVPDFTPYELHASHGAAAVSAMHDTDHLFHMTIEAQSGWAFTGMDWKLDAAGSVDGNAAFTAFDALGNQIPLDSGTSSFLFDAQGQNPYFGITSSGSSISKLVIDTDIEIADLKQVSVDLVQLQTIPLPAGAVLVLAGVGLVGATRRR